MRRLIEINFVVGVSCAAALLLTPLVRLLATRTGAVAKPVADRWHQRQTAMLGGIAIVVATVVGVAASWAFVRHAWMRPPYTTLRPAIGVAIAAGCMFVVGLIDDLLHLTANVKFVLQLLAGLVLVVFGALFQLTDRYVINVVLTLFWFVGVTNAFNLLDNMDGVAAGVAAIASFFLGLSFVSTAPLHAVLAWSLTGAALGFLRYNFHPASIFMGDCGSLFLGAVLAGLAVSSPTVVPGSLVSVLFVPLTIIAVPILDTVVVTVTRTLAGRPISQGGRDHSAHRLVALGLSEAQVALLLYAFAIAGGLIAALLSNLDRGLGILLGAAFLTGMALLAAYIGRMRVYEANTSQQKKTTLLIARLFYKGRLAEVLLDAALVTFAYYGAYRLRFGGALTGEYLAAFQQTVAFVIALKILGFSITGVYRAAWQYAGVIDVYCIIAGVLLSSVALFLGGRVLVPVLAHSGGIVIIDAILTASLVLTSRFSFRFLEQLRKSLQLSGERTLIYGAGDRGELIVRELVNNKALRLNPTCFLDDEGRKHGSHVHGVPIVGGLSALGSAVAEYQVSRIIIGTKHLTPETLAAVRAFAQEHGLGLTEMDLQFNEVISPPAVILSEAKNPLANVPQAESPSLRSSG